MSPPRADGVSSTPFLRVAGNLRALFRKGEGEGVEGEVTTTPGIKTHFLGIISVAWGQTGGGVVVVRELEDRPEVSSMGVRWMDVLLLTDSRQ